MKNIYIACFALIFSHLHAQTSSIESVFKLKWVTETGFSNFRANICFEAGKIIVPSNGSQRNKEADEKDGIYILDAKTGSIIYQIKPLDPKKEGDVASCSVGDGKVFFGNDAGWIYCYDLSGKKIWSRLLKGENDIEAAPVLVDLNQDQVLDAVFNQESTGTFAVDGKNGKTLWENVYEDNSGYMNSPSAYDLNGDKIPDIIVGVKRPFSDGFDNGNSLRVFNGANGKILWDFPATSGIHASPLVWIQQSVPSVVVAESYSSDINFLNAQGELKQTINLNDGGVSGLFSTPTFAPNGSILIGTSWWGDDDGIWFIPNKKEHYQPKKTSDLRKVLNQYDTEKHGIYIKCGRVSASACVADVLGNGQYQFIIPTENAELFIISNTGEVLKRLKLPEGVETTPLIKDVDGDGFLEIIIAGQTKTYCYKTNSKGRVYWSQFKGSNLSTGVVRY